MMFKKASRENISLWINLIGGTGSGKTMTAMRLASGMSEGKPFVVIDTENGRARHYADQFNFDCGDLREPFSPEAYTEAIHAADKAGYPVIVVDSVSHVWAGDGGVLDMQEHELDRMAGDDWKKRESCKMAAWIKPKMAHKKMVQSLLQVRAHLILCFRAEQKVEMVRENGKIVIHAKQSLTGLDGWIPVCDKSLPFEATTSLLFTADRPGIPQPIKLQEQHKALFPLDRQVNEESGKLIAQWAKGGTEKNVTIAMPTVQESKEGLDEFITADQAIFIGDLVAAYPAKKDSLIKRYGSIAKIPADKYQAATEWLRGETK
jgi:hypothetical protein